MEVHVMCGNIGSGKTTTLNKLIDGKDPGSFIIFDIDLVARAFNNNSYDPKIWTEAHFEFYHNIRDEMLSFAILEDIDVIIDDTNMKAETRLDISRICHYYNITPKLHVHRTKEALQRRLKGDLRGYNEKQWETIFNKFERQWEAPTPEEGYEIICVN